MPSSMARGTGSTLDIPASFCHAGQGFQSWPGLPVTGLQETNRYKAESRFKPGTLMLVSLVHGYI